MKLSLAILALVLVAGMIVRQSLTQTPQPPNTVLTGWKQ